MALTEIRGRVIDELRPGYFRARRLFLDTNAAAASDAHVLQGDSFTAWPIASTPAPRCARTHIDYDVIPGVAMVHAHYESTGLEKARIYFKSIRRKVRKMFQAGHEGEYDGSGTCSAGATYIIEGLESDGIHEWRVVKGTNVWWKSDMLIRVVTTYDYGSEPLAAIANCLDKANTDTVAIADWWSVTAGHLWLVDVSYDYTRFPGMTDVSYLFCYSPEAWATHVYTRRGVWVAEEAESFASDAGTGTNRTKIIYKPGKYLNLTDTANPVLSDSNAAKSMAVMETAAFAGLYLGNLTRW